MTACAVLYMGPGGQMLGFSAGWLSYGIAIAFLITILGLYLILGYQVWQTQHQLQQHPQIHLHHYPARLIDNQLLFSAQIGFWQPQLVIAQGLLDRLTPEQLNAVLTHEQAHSHYRDTFWFFWLGGVAPPHRLVAPNRNPVARTPITARTPGRLLDRPTGRSAATRRNPFISRQPASRPQCRLLRPF